MATMGYVLPSGIKGYSAWRKALWTDPELRDRFTASRQSKYDTRQIAEVVAMFGSNGRNCHAGAEIVAERIGCRRAVVERERNWLVDRQWFVKVRPVGRTFALDIRLPDRVGWEWRRGERSWAGPTSGVFDADLSTVPTGVILPDPPQGDGINWYPDRPWKPNRGGAPF